MNLLRVKAIAMLIACGSMFLVGGYMIWEGLMHNSEVDSGDHTELSIMSIGKIAGGQRIIIVGFGVLLIFMAAKFLYGIDARQQKSKFKVFRNAVTSTGKEIARRIRLKDLPDE